MSASASGPKGPSNRIPPVGQVSTADAVAESTTEPKPHTADVDAPLHGPHVAHTGTGSGSRLLLQALTDASDKLETLGERADAVLDLLGDAGYSGAAIRRHLKSLVRIAQQRSTAAQVRLRHRRLTRTEGLADLEERGVRRLVVRGADRETASDDASSSNPTTVFLDRPLEDAPAAASGK